jgi:hypothetical protein
MHAVELLGLLALKRTNLHEKSTYPGHNSTPAVAFASLVTT